MGYANCCTSAGCCGTGAYVRRRFISRAERVERLQAYQEALENELQGVTERIEALEEDV